MQRLTFLHGKFSKISGWEIKNTYNKAPVEWFRNVPLTCKPACMNITQIAIFHPCALPEGICARAWTSCSTRRAAGAEPGVGCDTSGGDGKELPNMGTVVPSIQTLF